MRQKIVKRLFSIFIFLFGFVFIFDFYNFNSSMLKNVQRNKSLLIFETINYSDHFCIAFNITKGSKNYRSDGLEPISLVIHGTSHYLQLIEEQANSWNGPISISLFVDAFSINSVEYLLNAHRCLPKIREKLNLHVVYRMSPFQQLCNPIVIEQSLNKCANASMRTKIRNRIPPAFGIYPINIMRNIARRGASSNIHMLADIDMIFSENFALKIKKIANEYIDGKQKKVLVIRRFEVENKSKVPKDHIQLLAMLKSFKAFEFHHKYFPAGHTIEGLWHWFKVSKNTSVPKAWKIKYKSSSWEPQMLLHRSDAYNPEYFPSRIRDQQALSYELCRSGYEFHIVSHVFNVHKGVKKGESSLATAVINHQKKFRLGAFKRFNRVLNETYPDTYESCGKFVM